VNRFARSEHGRNADCYRCFCCSKKGNRFELHARIPGKSLQLVVEGRVTLICPQPAAGTDGSVDDDDAGATDGGRRDSGSSEPRDDAGAIRATGGGCDCSAAGAPATENTSG
jgi:hypothetical protein